MLRHCRPSSFSEQYWFYHSLITKTTNHMDDQREQYCSFTLRQKTHTHEIRGQIADWMWPRILHSLYLFQRHRVRVASELRIPSEWGERQQTQPQILVQYVPFQPIPTMGFPLNKWVQDGQLWFPTMEHGLRYLSITHSVNWSYIIFICIYIILLHEKANTYAFIFLHFSFWSVDWVNIFSLLTSIKSLVSIGYHLYVILHQI